MQDERANGGKRTGSRRPDDVHLRDYVRVVLARKVIVLLIFLLFVSASFLHVRRLSPVYRSQVLLTRESASEALSSNVSALAYAYYFPETWDEGQELWLKSSSLLAEMKQRLAEEHNIEVALEQIGGSISLAPYKESQTVIQLTAVANTPEQAQALANAAADTYIEKTAETKKTELNQGLEFLKKQMDTLEEKTQEAEQALSDFQDREGLIPTTSKTGSSGLIEKLGSMQSELSQTESEIDLAGSQLQSIEELVSEKKKHAQSSMVTKLSPQIDQLQERLISLELELNTKLETLTKKDPEVMAAQRKIDIVQKQLRAEFSRLVETPGMTSLDPISELQDLMQQSVTLNAQLKGLERKSELVAERMNRFRQEHPELVSKQLELTRLERRARVYEQTSATLMGKYEDMRLMEQMKTSGLKIIDSAPLPEFPIGSNKKLTLTLAALLSLFLGIGVAFFLEYLDDSIKRKEDVERFLELPLMGAVPKMESFKIPEDAFDWDGKPGTQERDAQVFLESIGRSKRLDTAKLEKHPILPVGEVPEQSEGDDSDNAEDTPIPRARKRSRRQQAHRKKVWQNLLSHSLLYSSNGNQKSPGIESYRNLTANIKYATIDSPLRSLLVTSAMPREGKTITASNLAIVMAQSGTKTLLIDADLRHPNVHRIFQQDRAPGLTDLLISDDGLPQISPSHAEKAGGEASGPATRNFIRSTEVKDLYLLTCGTRVSNPGVLLPSEKMRELTSVLREQYDLIIFDSPPLGPVADAIALSTEVDGTLMVIYSGQTKRKIGLQAKESLENVNAKVIGAVLNNVDYAKQYGYYYYSYKYYSHYRYYRSDDDDE